jgi:hypothetical protein
LGENTSPADCPTHRRGGSVSRGHERRPPGGVGQFLVAKEGQFRMAKDTARRSEARRAWPDTEATLTVSARGQRQVVAEHRPHAARSLRWVTREQRERSPSSNVAATTPRNRRKVRQLPHEAREGSSYLGDEVLRSSTSSPALRAWRRCASARDRDLLRLVPSFSQDSITVLAK